MKLAVRQRVDRMNKELGRVERLGSRTAAEYSGRVVRKALSAYAAGKPLGDAVHTALAPCVDLLRDGLLVAHLLGYRRELQGAGLKLSAYDSAVKWLRQRMQLDDEQLELLTNAYDARALQVMGDLGGVVERELQNRVLMAAQKGMHVRDAKDLLAEGFESVGVDPDNAFTLENIFRTQMSTAYNAGRWQADRSPELDAIIWGYQYVTAADDRVRAAHRAMDGVTAPKDSPIWKQWWPPNGYSCRCQVLTLFAPTEEVEPPSETKDWRGNSVLVKPDAGFNSNVGEIFNTAPRLTKGKPRLPIKASVNQARAPKGSSIGGQWVKQTAAGHGVVEQTGEGRASYAGVTDDEWETWTTESANINALLRGESHEKMSWDVDGSDVTVEDAAKLKSIGERIDRAARSHVAVSPSNGNVLFRGESFDTVEQLKAKFPAGKKITLDGLTSAATSKDPAMEYATNDVAGPVRAMLKIQNPNGVLGIQTAPLGVPTNEVILSRGQQFRVASVFPPDEGRMHWQVNLYSTEKHNRKLPRVNVENPFLKTSAALKFAKGRWVMIHGRPVFLKPSGERASTALKYGGKEKGWQTVEGESLPPHAAKLGIPPAWTGVAVANDPSAKILARGFDAKGRRQAIYNDEFIMRQAAAKFERVQKLAKLDSKLGDQLAKDIKSNDPRIAQQATVVSLIRETGMRPGSKRDTKAAKQAYGATTLEGRHVVDAGGELRLKFTGKKGVELDIPVRNATIAQELRRRASAVGPSGRLFEGLNGGTIRGYLKATAGGDFKIKDLRTLKATKIALAEVAKRAAAPRTEKEYKNAVKEVAKSVAEVLGNTPSVALKSYINPAVFAGWKSAVKFSAKIVKTSAVPRWVMRNGRPVLLLSAAGQARAPKGSPIGGQWVSQGGGQSNSVDNVKESKVKNRSESWAPKGWTSGQISYEMSNAKAAMGGGGAIDNKTKSQRAIADRIMKNPKAVEEIIRGLGLQTELSIDYEVREFVKRAVSAWAHSSSDNEAMSITLQEAARKQFGVTRAAKMGKKLSSVRRDVRALQKKYPEAIREFLQAQYDVTQEHFAKKGITHVTLQRGYREVSPTKTKKIHARLTRAEDRIDAQAAKGKEVEQRASIVRPMKLRPLSSWTADSSISAEFAGKGESSFVLTARVPVKRILSIPQTGLGCTYESEYVVLGGKQKVRIHARNLA